jgi:hypothetical protein
MKKDNLIEITPDKLMVVLNCILNKKLNLEIASNYNMYVRYKEKILRVEDGNLKVFYKRNKEFRNKEVTVILHKNNEIRKILWGMGRIGVGNKVVGVNGSFDFKIDNYVLFNRSFGNVVTLNDFKRIFIDRIKEIVSTVIFNFAKEHDLKLDEMMSNKLAAERQINQDMKNKDVDCESLGVSLREFKVESFIVN